MILKVNYCIQIVLFVCCLQLQGLVSYATDKHSSSIDTATKNAPIPGKEKTGAVKRFGSVTGLKADKLAYYKKLHAAAWPTVLRKIKECNIRNYSIYLKKIDGKYFLFSYFEYTGSNFDKDMQLMAADSTTRQWWKETAPCQQPLPDAASKGQIWSNMEEVFHTN